MARKRRVNVFALSLLDVMAGGFGAVVVLFLIINHATEETHEESTRDLLAEARLLDFREENELKDLTTIQEKIDELKNKIKQIEERLRDVAQDLENRNEDIGEMDIVEEAEIAELERLKAKVESERKELDILLEEQKRDDRQAVIEVQGEGDRQYLTDLVLGGRRILIALDTSASMLDDTIVNVIRRRNMPLNQRLQSPKWQRAVRTVEWLIANLPLDSAWQVITFAEEAEIIGGDGNKWIPASDAEEALATLEKLEKIAPVGGTNLYNLMMLARKIRPLTDNMFLIVDSLPTQGRRATKGNYVTGRERAVMFEKAAQEAPPAARINVILFPMEGDPIAPGSYWQLAALTGGTFLAPSKDWP